ncbi:MAG: hypothetical protein IKX20_06450 [Paludibacteraceae bacterium]|nr:hypothetical protein [Paludibacteraceae bacterium]
MKRKEIWLILFQILVLVILAGALIGICANSYFITNRKENSIMQFDSAEEFESALRDGYDLKNTQVTFQVEEIKSKTLLGYNVWAGEHLNFYPSEKPQELNCGDYVTVKVKKIKNFLFGSYRVFCEIQHIEPGKE